MQQPISLSWGVGKPSDFIGKLGCRKTIKFPQPLAAEAKGRERVSPGGPETQCVRVGPLHGLKLG